MRKANWPENKWVGRIVFYLSIFALWEVCYQMGVVILRIWKPYSFPSPFGVAESLISLIQDNTLQIATGASLFRIAIGYGLSVMLGILIGLFILQTGRLGEHFSSLILGLQALPSICWVPFAILWYGLNQSAIIFVIVIGSTFAIAISVESSIRSVNPLYIRVAKNTGINKISMYIDVIFPAALPGILAGLKQGWSFAWRSLMAGEMMTATLGLGQVLMVGRDLADISQVVAIMTVIVALGLGVDHVAFGAVEKRLRKQWGVHSTSNELLRRELQV